MPVTRKAPSSRAIPVGGFFFNDNKELRANNGTQAGEDTNRQGGLPRVALAYREQITANLSSEDQQRIDGVPEAIAQMCADKGISVDMFTVCVLDKTVQLIANPPQPTAGELKALAEVEELRAKLAQLEAQQQAKEEEQEQEQEQEEEEQEQEQEQEQAKPTMGKGKGKGKGKKW